MSDIVLMSIKPKYAELIFRKGKWYEYRRVFNPRIKTVVVYVSHPVKMIVGEFNVAWVWKESPLNLWDDTAFHGIEVEDFMKYFRGCKYGYAIKIGNLYKYKTPVPLSHYGMKRPPQSYCYLKDRITALDENENKAIKEWFS